MKFLFVFCCLYISTGFTFSQIVKDTIDSPNGKILMYTNQTWEYLHDQNFDGVLNEAVEEYFSKDTLSNFTWPWNSNICYSSNRSNDMTMMKDTLWLCVTDSANSDFVIPFDGKITSRYGYRRGRYHNGIDISLNTGDTVVAAFDGKVRYSKMNRAGFGNLVIIRHFNGLETYYAHLSKRSVVPNQYVKAGEMIGLGGNTGRSYGAHLHFETRFYDAPINPEEFIDFENKTIRNENLFVHRGLFIPGIAPTHKLMEKYKTNGSPASLMAVMEKESYYHIKSGDTLGAIARRNNTSVSQLCKLNNISTSTTLRIGRRIRVR